LLTCFIHLNFRQVTRIRNDFQSREESLVKLEEETKENAERVKEEVDAWQRKNKLRDRDQHRREKEQIESLNIEVQNRDTKIHRLERDVKELNLKLENSADSETTTEYLGKLEIVLGKARDRIQLLERQNPGFKILGA